LEKVVARAFDEEGWGADATVSLRKGSLRAPTPTTLNQAAAAWLEGARSGSIRTRSGELYKPSAIRSYDTSLKLRVLPDLGGARLADVRRVDVQDLADRLLASGLDPSTIRNTLMPLRAIFRRAVARGELAVNATRELELPAVQGRRDRIASPEEASSLLRVLPEADRALWATAFYAGLRRGELRGLRWGDVDLSAGVIHVRRAWDDRVGAISPKSKAGLRDVPIVAALRTILLEHRLRSGRSEGFVFGSSASVPFSPQSVRERALRVWKDVQPIGLHEARHTFASVLIFAGVNVKAISTYMGHSSITITLDRYGHPDAGSRGGGCRED
jgi:integrase